MVLHRQRAMLTAIALTLAGSLAFGALGGYVVWRAGWYDVRATSGHWQVVFDLLERGMRHSIARRAASITVPPLDGSGPIALGAAMYRDKCVQCHGGPGVAPHDIGKSMQPLPGPLVDAARRWQPAELYQITRHGIKMSGMPAWEFHLSEQELWAVVAFLQTLPALSPADYAQLMRSIPSTPPGRPSAPPERGGAQVVRPGDSQRGRLALTQYGCAACHIIPGVTGPRVYVGPPLDDLGGRKYLAGRLPNTPRNLAQWIVAPRSVDPHTAMPDLGVTVQDAVDISAYLLQR